MFKNEHTYFSCHVPQKFLLLSPKSSPHHAFSILAFVTSLKFFFILTEAFFYLRHFYYTIILAFTFASTNIHNFIDDWFPFNTTCIAFTHFVIGMHEPMFFGGSEQLHSFYLTGKDNNPLQSKSTPSEVSNNFSLVVYLIAGNCILILS